MNPDLFSLCCDKVVHGEVIRDGIGTLSEKTLHAVLKNYFEPDTTYHEVKIGKHYADIYNAHGITEIQTKQFNKLRNKLDVFLKNYVVTIVFPVASEKTLYWVDQETGEISKGRKSPKRGSVYSIFPELYKVKSLLKHNNIRFCITLVHIEEYRFLNGWSRDGKKGSTCSDRIPTKLVEERYITCVQDYLQFIPHDLPSQFDSREFATKAKIPISLAQTVLHILTEVCAVKRVGKRGRSILYERSHPIAS